MNKRERILELSRLGMEPNQILAQMAKEGMGTTPGRIYKVRSQAKAQGEVFPHSDENPARTEAVAASGGTPRRGKGSRSPRVLYERKVGKIAKRQSDLEYRAAANPKMIPAYVLEIFPRLEARIPLWTEFRRMAEAQGSVRAAIDETIGLVPPFLNRVANSLANGNPPPKIQDYAAEALRRWVEKFVAEKRGSKLVPGRAGTTCGACGNRLDVYKDGTEQGFFCWCVSCLETRVWTCSLCGSQMKITAIGKTGYGPVCTGCGRVLVFNEAGHVHVAESWEGERLWKLLLGATESMHRTEAWTFVKIAEKNPEMFDNPDLLHRHISILLPAGVADRVVGKFFEIEYANPVERGRRRREAEEREYEKWFERMLKLKMIMALS